MRGTSYSDYVYGAADVTALARFEAKVEKHEADCECCNGCWFWTAHMVKGYGRLRFEGKVAAAHRVAYVLFVGPIPEGHDLHHVCVRRSCANPWHLQVVTRATHRHVEGVCSNGHAYPAENRYARKGRRCAICLAAAVERHRVRHLNARHAARASRAAA